MTQKEQKNQIKNLLACAERLLCCMTEVQQDMDEAAKSIKQQKLLSDEIASKLENKLSCSACGETFFTVSSAAACTCSPFGAKARYIFSYNLRNSSSSNISFTFSKSLSFYLSSSHWSMFPKCTACRLSTSTSCGKLFLPYLRKQVFHGTHYFHVF